MNDFEKSIYNRTERLVGSDVMARLEQTRVIIFGVGGVGSWCAEGLLRTGVTHLTIVDADCVDISNVNRQMMATAESIGQVKVEAMKAHLLTINPNAEITALQAVYSSETKADFNLNDYDYVVDAIDSLKDKAQLILDASASKAKFYCSLGAALKLDPTRVRVAEFWEVNGCPLGAALRKKLKKAKTLPAKKFLCVYDPEVLPNRGEASSEQVGSFTKAVVNGTVAPITSIFGMTLAGLIIQNIYESFLKSASPEEA